jgi:pheromone alpha factor receptor
MSRNVEIPEVNIIVPTKFTLPTNVTILKNLTAVINSTLSVDLSNATIFKNLTTIINDTTSGNLIMAVNSTSANSTMRSGFLPGEDGYNQTITMLFPDGSPFNISMTDLTYMNNVNIAMGLMYGIQIGLALIMLIVTLLLTQKGKRRSLIFFCNVAALVLDIPRSALIATWLTSMWNNPYVYFTHDTSRLTTGNIVASIIGQPFKLFEIIAIQISLITQVRVVLMTSPSFLRRCIIAILFTLSLITLGMEIGLSIINAKQIAKTADPLPIQPHLAKAADIMLSIFIACAMLVFVWKLAYALKNRRNLGLVKFGPMQVVFIMGVQTMVVPSEYFLFPFLHCPSPFRPSLFPPKFLN